MRCTLEVFIPIFNKFAAVSNKIGYLKIIRIELLEIPRDQILLGNLHEVNPTATCFGVRDEISFGFDSTKVDLSNKLNRVRWQNIRILKERS